MEEEYNNLRSLFGSSRGADQIPFADYCALDEISIGELLQKVENFVSRGRLAKLRKEALRLSASGSLIDSYSSARAGAMNTGRYYI